MKKITTRLIPALLVFLLMPSAHRAVAQPWDDFVDKTFVFQIDNREAEKLLRSSSYSSLNEQMLHTQVGEFTGKWEDQPDQGHFIYANIKRNKVDYRYVPVMPFKVFLYKEYGILTLQVVDNEGNIRHDAKIRIAGKRKLFNKRIDYDRESQVYRIDDWSEKRYRMLTVELNGFRAVFDLTKHLVSPYYNWNNDNFYSLDFYSYMITDKNKYKPGETVRFKSYALTGSRRPLKKELEVWLRVDGRYKKIDVLSPYNPGGYAGGLHLHDSLELKLDRHYDIQLREPRGRIVAGRSFKYEDYVLYDNKLEVEVAERTHYYPDENEITIKVTDSNGLLALDVKADVTISRRSIDRSFSEVLTVPDILMNQTISLDNEAPTKVTIPADILGNANGTYDVGVKVLTYDGQVMHFSDMVYYRRSSKEMTYTTRNDTIRFEYLETGKPVGIRAQLQYDGKGTAKRVDLPYEEPFDQGRKSYRFIIPEKDFERSFPVDMMGSELYLQGGIEKDSFKVKLINPLDLEVSWYIYRGNLLINKGAGREMNFSVYETEHDAAFYAEVFYFMGESEESHRRTFLPQKDHLTIELDMPDRVYPGQTLDATVNVRDNLGHPVRNADLTAFAYNNLLNYNVPEMEYYGSDPRMREERSSYSIDKRGYRFGSGVDYKFWKDRAKLDSLPYYRFIYPKGVLFRSTVDTPDGITQFAPFVMSGGNSVKIHVIEINNEPVWFSWTEQPQAYSFPVDVSKKNNIRLRLHDRVLILEDIWFAPGKKTVLSVDLNDLPGGVKTVWLDIRPGSTERDRYKPLISSLPVYGNNNTLSITGKGDTVMIYHPQLSRNFSGQHVLAGPIPQGKARYANSVEYVHEGGYRYRFNDNVVYKHDAEVVPVTFDYGSSEVINELGDFYLSSKVIDEVLDRWLWKERFWQPAAIYISKDGMEMKFRIPEKADTTGVANLVFVDRDSLRVVYPKLYEKDKRAYSSLTPGSYDAVLIYNNGRYIRYDSLTFAPNTYTEVDMGAVPVRESDRFSREWRNKFLSVETHPASFIGAENTRLLYFRDPGTSGSIIRGYVHDSDGQPITGATVMIKGTMTGNITNIDGYFELPVEPGNHDIIVSFIGYRTYEATVRSGSLIYVTLEEDAQMLSEVVVVGYGVSMKRSVTGSLAGVSGSGPPPQARPEELDDDGEPLTPDKDAEDRLYRELISLGGIRSNFSDVGFWEPSLVTDRKGQASFTVTFPDNITKWDAVVYAMNRRLKTGTYRKSIRSYKPLMAELRMPGFLVEGDVSMFAGNLRNFTSEQLVSGTATFTSNGDTLSSEVVEFSSSLPDRMEFRAPEGADSLKAAYVFNREDGYTDGEERTIAVIPRGTEIADGVLALMRGDQRIDITAEEGETVEVIVTGNQLDIYLDAAWYLYGYKHACNEQLASKLIGLMNVRLYKLFKGETFDYDREVNDIIRRLVANRNSGMLWSWFGNSPQTSFWMSAHILRALRAAKEQGYNVNLDFSRLQYDYTDVSPYREPQMTDIEILHVLSEWGAEQKYEPAVEYWEERIARLEFIEDSIAAARKPALYTKRSFLKEKLHLWDIRRMQGLEYDPDEISAYFKTDMFGAVRCDDDRPRSWYHNALTTTLAAYKIVRADSALMHYKEPMQLYVLGTKSSGWNTYYSASAIGTIFPDLINPDSSGRPAGLILTGKENRTVEEFPYKQRLMPGESLGIEKSGGIPLIYSAYTRKLVTEERTGDAFDITTVIEGDGPLEIGKEVTLRVDVSVKQDNAEYVMIEVPIPAGCDYASKYQSYYRPEVHREHYKEKTIIYCERMPEGKYTFRIRLLPRFSGTYSLNPAKAELMYFPVISSNNDLREVNLD